MQKRGQQPSRFPSGAPTDLTTESPGRLRIPQSTLALATRTVTGRLLHLNETGTMARNALLPGLGAIRAGSLLVCFLGVHSGESCAFPFSVHAGGLRRDN